MHQLCGTRRRVPLIRRNSRGVMTGLGVAEAEVALDAAADAEAVSLGAVEVVAAASLFA